MTEPQTTPMTLNEAIESLQKSLAQGDKMMKSETWSGGSFKSPAIRTVLAALKNLEEWKAKNEEEGDAFTMGYFQGREDEKAERI